MADYFGHLSESEFEELKRTFYSQAYESVENLQDLALILESNPEDEDALKALKRHLHTLKGDSNSFGLTSAGALCHSIEDMLQIFTDGPRDAEHEAIDLLLNCIEVINRILLDSESGRPAVDTDNIMRRIDGFVRTRNALCAVEGQKPKGPDLTEYQQMQLQDAEAKGLNLYEMEIDFHPMCADRSSAAFIIVQKLNSKGSVIHTVPDIESSDIETTGKMHVLFSTAFNPAEIKEDTFIAGITDNINVTAWYPEHGPQTWRGRQDSKTDGVSAVGVQSSSNRDLATALPNRRTEMLRIESSKVDKIMNLMGEIIIGRSMIEQAARELRDGASANDVAARLYAANSYMERTVADLQNGIMKMRMVPVNHVFRKFPKIVRDLCAEKGKMARLDMRGKETELDKSIVDALGEPLSHILRNMIDHGIEEPSARKSSGKPEEGVITLMAYHEAAQIVIEASDDGKGIDTERLRQKAVEIGYLSADAAEKISDSEAVNLIFASGLSTSDRLSETSGRGIGMDAVKSAVSGLRGSIEVESEKGRGTLFRVRLPLTLAVIKALLFMAGQRVYAIPISAVSDVARVDAHELTTVDGKDTFMLRDRIISVIRLCELLKTDENESRKKFILILSTGGKKVGMLVDRIIGQQEIVIKAVDNNYVRSDIVAGASILGDGKVILILDASAIFKRAVEDEKKRAVGT